MNLTDYIVKRNQTRPVYMPYLTAGDPDLDATVRFAGAMFDAGADILELGIPFSDPTADGPVIEAAMVRSLQSFDFTMDAIFETVGRIHAAHPDRPIVLLGYLNTVLHSNLPETLTGETIRETLLSFIQKCAACGVAGIVIPDLPHDEPESVLFRELAAEYEISQILMVAPNTTDRRLQEIARHASGFIYYVTSLGVTGVRKELPEGIRERIKRVQGLSGLPVLAGFGIGSPEQATVLKRDLNGIIVGSLHHRIIDEHGHQSEKPLGDATEGFVAALQ